MGNKTARSFPAGSQPQSVAVGDFNGDGLLDLVVANYGSNNVSVLLAKGDGTFRAARNFSVGSGAIAAAVEDFNRDGFPDLTAVGGSNVVSILLNDGTWPP